MWVDELKVNSLQWKILFSKSIGIMANNHVHTFDADRYQMLHTMIDVSNHIFATSKINLA